MEARARRVFVAVWVLLGLAGALDHTVAEKVLGERVELYLPQLAYGYVMFNLNPRTVPVYEYAGADGARHDLADLVEAPAPGYARARLAIDVEFQPAYLAEVCLRAVRAHHEEYEFFVSEYDVGVDRTAPASVRTLHCGPRGLVDAQHDR